MNRIVRILTPLLCLAGVLIFSMLGIRTLANRKVFLKTTGTITDIRVEYDTGAETGRHDVYVAYTADGRDYISVLGEYDASMAPGQSIAILYNPQNPQEIMSAGILGPAPEFVMAALCLAALVILIRRRLNGQGE